MDASPKQVVNVLAREGKYWTVVFGGRVSRVRDAKGLHYLDHLVRHPGEEVHAFALISAVEPPPPAGPRPGAAAGELSVGSPGDAGPVLDATAVAAYRRRFQELQEELAEAEHFADDTGAARAREELDALAEQLAGGLGLGGRHRRAGSAAERARLAVTKAIRSAIRRLDEADPELGRHLDRTVRTGTFCAYSPDPALGMVWLDKAAEPQGAPPPLGNVSRAPRSPARAFVGRALERGLMHEVVAAAAAGRGGLLLVQGEAGIGKTRLAEEAIARAEERGMGTFVGRCREADTALAWLPLVEVLGQLVDDLDDAALSGLLGGTGPEVARVLPALRRRFPDLPPPVDVPAEHGRQFLYATIRDLLLRLGAARPAVLVLEDIHWADAATLTMLEHLVEGLVDGRVLVVATYRSDEALLGTPLARALERLVRHPACTTIALAALDPPEVGELLTSLTGRVPPPTLAARLCAEADGNPFFVEELVKHLASEGRLYAADGDFRPDLGLQPPAVPEGLRLLLGHRLQRLSPQCREVLDLAAVVGRDVDVDLLTAVLGTDEPVMTAVEEAVAAGVLVTVLGAADDRLGFRHALLRQAALTELSTIRRRRLHQRAAEALQGVHGEDPEHAGEIADHLERAGTAAGAATSLRFLELAARRSLESAAYEDAADRFRRALAVVPDADAGTRARLLAGLGYAQRGLGFADEAKRAWLDALDLVASGGGQTPLVAELCRALGRYLDATGGLDQAVAVLERGLRAVGSAPTAERSRLQSALAYTHALDGHHTAGAACIEEAAAIAETLDDDRLRADVLASRTSLEFTAGRLRECVETAEAAERALLACGQVWDAVQAQVTTSWPRLWLGRVADARRHVAQLLPVAERVRHTPAMFLLGRSAALLDLVQEGNVDRYAAQAVEGVAFCRTNRLRWLADAHVFAGLAGFWRGDSAAAAEHLRAAATAPAPPVYAGRYSATLLTYLAWSGEADAFDQLAAELHERFDSLDLRRTLGTMAVTLAEVEGLALLGRPRACAALYPAVKAILDEGVVLRPPDLRIVPALAGLTAGLAGDLASSDLHFEDARRLVATLPFPRQAPDVDFLQSLVQGDDALLARALGGYEALGMPIHQARAEREAPMS